MIKKIHIIGSIGSGKTTLAKQLATQLKIPHYELDNIVWERHPDGDKKRSITARNARLNKTIQKEAWIIEGAHHTWIAPSIEEADLIIFLDTKLTTRKQRILTRFIKQKLNIEPANYQPTLKTLGFLYQYNTIFENEAKPEILKLLEPYKEKVKWIQTSKELRTLIKTDT